MTKWIPYATVPRGGRQILLELKICLAEGQPLADYNSVVTLKVFNFCGDSKSWFDSYWKYSFKCIENIVGRICQFILILIKTKSLFLVNYGSSQYSGEMFSPQPRKCCIKLIFCIHVFLLFSSFRLKNLLKNLKSKKSWLLILYRNWKR